MVIFGPARVFPPVTPVRSYLQRSIHPYFQNSQWQNKSTSDEQHTVPEKRLSPPFFLRVWANSGFVFRNTVRSVDDVKFIRLMKWVEKEILCSTIVLACSLSLSLDVVVYVKDIYQPSLPTPFFILFLCLFLSIWPFHLNFTPLILPNLRFLTLFFRS